jgi:hypothetical protein
LVETDEMKVPPLTFRIEKGAPLDSEDHDENLRLLRDFCDGLARLFEIVFNADGTLKNDTIGTGSLQDRSVTQAKLDWLANFYATASGVDDYTVAITPNAGFDYGDGAATAFMLPVKFTNANTGAVTLEVNSGGAKPVKKNGGSSSLIAGDIAAGSIHFLVFDGTNFQMVSPISDPAQGHGLLVIDAAGAGNFTVPVGVTVLEVELVGGGGGGGGTDPQCNGGGGGGYVYKRMTVTPGDVVAYVVGAAGTASTGGNAGNGGDTTFGALTAGGGKGGDATLGAGGTASGGDLNIPGENGAYGGGVLSSGTTRAGGGSGRGMGRGGFVNGANFPATGYGGGGHGDTDAGGGFDSSDGTAGVIIITW